jgi:hypothetical protein
MATLEINGRLSMIVFRKSKDGLYCIGVCVCARACAFKQIMMLKHNLSGTEMERICVTLTSFLCVDVRADMFVYCTKRLIFLCSS